MLPLFLLTLRQLQHSSFSEKSLNLVEQDKRRLITQHGDLYGMWLAKKRIVNFYAAFFVLV